MGELRMTTIANMRHDPALRERLAYGNESGNEVRIDRRTKWGNPFHIGHHGDRAEVIARFRRYLAQKIRAGEITLEELAALNGKTICCWCAPDPCHGDVLARAAEWAANQLESKT